jgi:hypothetical protein
VLVEVKLQLLVGHVDAQLLEAVLRKVFKPENVEDADVGDAALTLLGLFEKGL